MASTSAPCGQYRARRPQPVQSPVGGRPSAGVAPRAAARRPPRRHRRDAVEIVEQPRVGDQQQRLNVEVADGAPLQARGPRRWPGGRRAGGTRRGHAARAREPAAPPPSRRRGRGGARPRDRGPAPPTPRIRRADRALRGHPSLPVAATLAQSPLVSITPSGPSAAAPTRSATESPPRHDSTTVAARSPPFPPPPSSSPANRQTSVASDAARGRASSANRPRRVSERMAKASAPVLHTAAQAPHEVQRSGSTAATPRL